MEISAPFPQRRVNGHTIDPSSDSAYQTTRYAGAAAAALASAPTSTTTTMNTAPLYQAYQKQNPVPAPYMPGGARSLSLISFHAFALGTSFGLCTVLTMLLLYIDVTTNTVDKNNNNDIDTRSGPGYTVGYLWRLPLFIAILSLFHYLEFYMTARYNTVDARVSSFLLFNNGWAYNAAHCAAMVECLVRWFCWSVYAPSFSSSSLSSWFRLGGMFGKGRDDGDDDGGGGVNAAVKFIPGWVFVSLGLALVVLGQTTRSLAMKTAGTSFNHIVQSTKKEDHVLITSGVYGWCRHPSYFGFFWWGMGTQFVLGNWICFVAYGVVLWKFFAHRIFNEERHLIQFFGDAYADYKRKTPVLIPFIR